jgi:Leucine-rich repeat (LRR) protein
MRRWNDARNTKNLNISHFQLRIVPVEVLVTTSLTRLDLSNNLLRGTLDPQLSVLTSLTELNVSHNRLVDIHHKLVTLTGLTSHHIQSEGFNSERGGLRWHGNSWRSPPFPVRIQGTQCIFSYLSAYTRGFETGILRLEGTDLRHLPYETLRMTHLTTLDLSRGNQLLVLPPTLTVLQALENLLADDNRLVYIHPELGKLARLRQLSIKNNRLLVLPHELSAITALANLKYSGNPLSGPPEGALVSVHSLVKILEETKSRGEPFPEWMRRILTGVDLTSDRDDSPMMDQQRRSGDLTSATATATATATAVEATLMYLRNFFTARGSDLLGIKGTLDLDLRGLGLGHVPHEVADLHWSGLQHRHSDMTQIRHIRLDHNPIAEIPEHLNAWKCVQTLTLNNCMLRSLPAVLGNWEYVHCLEHLEASNNALRTLDVPPGSFTALKVLDLDNNDFTVLPLTVGWLTSLRVLSLRDNKIVFLPPSVWRMQNLRALYVDRNGLQRVCPELGALSANFPPRESIMMDAHISKGGPELDWILRPPGSPIPCMPEDDKKLYKWREHCGGLEREGESVYGSLLELTSEGNRGMWSPPPEVQDLSAKLR